MLENQTATREQPSNEQLYWLKIERVHLVNNCRVKSAIVASQQGLFQVSTGMPCDPSGVANSFEAGFLDFLA